jgi:hypothetical protein
MGFLRLWHSVPQRDLWPLATVVNQMLNRLKPHNYENSSGLFVCDGKGLEEMSKKEIRNRNEKMKGGADHGRID